MRQLARQIETDYLAFCEVAQRAIEESWFSHYGYHGPQPYFEDKIGVSYRTVRRRLTVLEAIERLPEGERLVARAALASIGGHKAAVIAPLLGHADNWEEFITLAEDATEDALQEAVSVRLGLQRKGPASQPGHRFMAFLLANVPPDERQLVEAAFAAGMRELKTENAVAVFLVMVSVFVRDLADMGVDVTVPSAPK